MRLAAGGLLLALVAALPAGAGESSKERALDALFAEYDRTGSPGLAVGIYRDGKPVYTAGYGYADLENNVAITPRTVFHIASVSKQFTAFSAALLERDGKLDLDADLRERLPYVPDFGHTITPRHLIYHTSGLRDQFVLFQLAGHNVGDVLRQAQVINLVSRQRALNFTPGTDHSYDNTGYTLLAELVKAVSGSSLREFTDARIFRPLGMHDTFFYDDVTGIVPNRAHSYENQDGKWHRALLSHDNVGATSLHTTVGDLLKWAGNFAHPVVGDAALIREISTMGRLDDGTPINYGFGLTKETVAGHEALLHTGSDAGFVTVFAYFPAEDFGVVLLANTWMRLEPRLEQVVALYLNDGDLRRAALPAVVRPKRGLAASLPGDYLRPSGSLLTIQADAKGLSMSTWRRPGEPLTFRADGSFDTGDEPRQFGDFFRPVLDGRGRVTALEYGGPNAVKGRVLRFPRADAVTPSPADLGRLVGDYRSAELDITYRVSMEGDGLTIGSLWSTAPIKLFPTVRDRFDGAWPIGSLAVERDGNGRPVALRLSNGRVRGLRLDRQP